MSPREALFCIDGMVGGALLLLEAGDSQGEVMVDGAQHGVAVLAERPRDAQLTSVPMGIPAAERETHLMSRAIG